MVRRTAAFVAASRGDFASEATVDCDAKLFRFRGERPLARRGSEGNNCLAFEKSTRRPLRENNIQHQIFRLSSPK